MHPNRPPFGDFSLTMGYAFSAIPSHKGYTFSEVICRRVYTFTEICSKAKLVKKIHKKGLPKHFYLTKGMVFNNFSLTNGMLFPNFSLTKRPILNIDAAYTGMQTFRSM